MKTRAGSGETLAALACTFPIPLVFGCGVARLFGIWIGLGAGVLSGIFSILSMRLLWYFARRWRSQPERSKPVDGKEAT